MRKLAALIALALAAPHAQTAAERSWKLPSSLAVKQDGARAWNFTCDYYYLDTKGHISRRARVAAEYTRGLPGDMARWNGVTVANASGESGNFGPRQKRVFMEGFSYPHTAVKDMLSAEFFRGFPATANEERNLVWDTHMIEGFGQDNFEHLELNIPYHVPETAAMAIAGMGTFRHKDLQLIWTGITKRNGQECAVIDYRAFFNALEMKNPGMALTARSNYWGQVWVSLATKQIEYGTLYEDVLGEVTVQALEKPMIINVFRIGVFEPAG